MSNFNPPPTDGGNHCGINGCPDNQVCFLYSGGSTCQSYAVPATYPPVGDAATLVNPPGWYFYPGYPTIRYTGSLKNQTQDANCTTIPIPPNMLYTRLFNYIITYDLGRFLTALDINYSSTLMLYRGNCDEGFYCNPRVPVNTTYVYTDNPGSSIRGELPGTCQPLKAEGSACASSNMCMGWHIQPDGSYDNDQFRCQTSRASPTSGICTNMAVGKGVVNFGGGSTIQRTARTYLLSTLLLFCLVFLYLWYRRQKIRQRQRAMAMAMASGDASYHDNLDAYNRQAGVNRRPDENDNGELPAYGMHRRDERVTGPAAEEIGMYSFPTGAGPPLPPPISPNGSYPPPSSINRPVQQNYPFPMTHPAMMNTMLAPNATTLPPGSFYPPPSSEPAPLTAQQAEAAAIAAAAAAAIPTPLPIAASLQEGGLLPPAYEPATTTGPLPQAAANPGTTTAAALVSTSEDRDDGTLRTGDNKADKQELDDDGQHQDSTLSEKNEKSTFHEKDPDQASTSSGSGASGSGSGSSSVVNSISGKASKS
ncbi:hypothetical protein BGX28_001243 [Mortierella sp. GBA30]|nr:hypothetical protein BGX28_001243 [Mortierella sp. GBA30]